jgi:hypothetical protein
MWQISLAHQVLWTAGCETLTYMVSKVFPRFFIAKFILEHFEG